MSHKRYSIYEIDGQLQVDILFGVSEKFSHRLDNDKKITIKTIDTNRFIVCFRCGWLVWHSKMGGTVVSMKTNSQPIQMEKKK